MVTFTWAVAVGALLAERRWPAVRLPAVTGWTWRAGAFVLVEVLTVGFTLLLCGMGLLAWAGAVPIFSLSEYPVAAQVAVNYLISTMVFYWWHRVRHDNHFLWLLTHQFHHSASRIETITAFYKHPLEVALDTALNFALSFLLLGVSVEAFIGHIAVVASMQLFVHMNFSTPRWLGCFIQRPEMHRIHHARDAHRDNYSDLPLWDMLFGTYCNPAIVSEPCGFTPTREARVRAMLACKDVHATQN
jgi:sterol desaturase/sphingolipid hydroxylase (fatty acid hydroxylase superfamily)